MPSLRLDLLPLSPSEFLAPALSQLKAWQNVGLPLCPSGVISNRVWQGCIPSLKILWHNGRQEWLQCQANGALPDSQHLKAMAIALQQALPPLDIGNLEQVVELFDLRNSAASPEPKFLVIPYFYHQNQKNQNQDFAWGMVASRLVAYGDLYTHIQLIYRDMLRAKNLYLWWQHDMTLEQLGVNILVQPLDPDASYGWATLQYPSPDIQCQTCEPDHALEPDQTYWHITPLEAFSCHPLGDRPRRVTYLIHGQTGRACCHTSVPVQRQGAIPVHRLSPEDQSPQQKLSPEQQDQLGRLLMSLTDWPGPLLWQCHGDRLRLSHGLIEPSPSQSPLMPLRLLPVGEGLAAASGQAMAPALVVNDLAPPATASGHILVASAILPHWLPLVRSAVGVICEQGGLTSHGAILSRELSRPAVVALKQARQRIKTGEMLFLDGNQGWVYRLDPQQRVIPLASDTPSPSPPQATTPNPGGPQVMVNVSQASALDRLTGLAIAGIGLLRSELMLLGILGGQHPYRWLESGRSKELGDLWAAEIAPFIQAIAPRPLFYRCLDLRSHEYRALIDGDQWEPNEANPLLGLRGTCRYILHPALFDLELSALRQAITTRAAPLRLILPFVRSLEEIEFCQERITAAGLDQVPGFQLWVMAEVPALLFMLPDLVERGVKGISIGTNDLIQLLLGIDRDEPPLGLTLDEAHPSVKAAIEHFVRTAQRVGLGCSICGELPAHNSAWIPWLVNLGIDTISVSPEAVMTTQAAIQQTLELMGPRGRSPLEV
ncbi:hypothetical protein L3556_12035 [Candidatus Synechococcus calcipolaris G9]|uniref:Pyruvate, water dikinase n=1 Tax=Candidatus Synechococcus calcipolaris G9 TaxID=1497997 RepID=A0ABT6F1B4_9SYNE|nr:putative PEP-binding protein [Candidatus Synechococcus calcipolaris]MDG2991656.1 hypothetical protein [Candidatus Synechococcus calcipolaris G9]